MLLKVAKIITLLSKTRNFPSLSRLSLQCFMHWLFDSTDSDFHMVLMYDRADFQGLFQGYVFKRGQQLSPWCIRAPPKDWGFKKSLTSSIFSCHFRRESRRMLPVHAVKDSMKSTLSGESWFWGRISPSCCAKRICSVKGNKKCWCFMSLKLLS